MSNASGPFSAESTAASVTAADSADACSGIVDFRYLLNVCSSGGTGSWGRDAWPEYVGFVAAAVDEARILCRNPMLKVELIRARLVAKVDAD